MSANLSNLANDFGEGDTTYEDISSSHYPSYFELAKGQSGTTKGPPSTLNVTNSPLEVQAQFHSKMSAGGGDQLVSKSILKNKSDSSSTFRHQQRQRAGTSGKEPRSNDMAGIGGL